MPNQLLISNSIINISMNLRIYFFRFFKFVVSSPSLLWCLGLNLFVLTINGQSVTIDGHPDGKRFDGIGVVHGGEVTSSANCFA